MNDWDIILYKNDYKRTVEKRFRLAPDREMSTAGQHGQPTIFVDEQGSEWLLKIFNNILDHEMQKITDLDVDITNAEISKQRMHLWRVLCELTASRLGRRLHLNVPNVYLVTSSKVASFKLTPSTSLTLDRDIIILDEEEGAPETAEEYYGLSHRVPTSIATSAQFETLLKTKSRRNKPSEVLGVLIQKIPDSLNLDEYLDTQEDLDAAFRTIQQVDDGYFLLPFDVWLNDPDRNAGNYLVQFDGPTITRIWGIDYEMWALGASDVWMENDDLTKGRSYLTAIIHAATDIFDSRMMQTLHRIRSLSDSEITAMTQAPQLLCKFFEYQIEKNKIHPDERIVLKQIETNLVDFLLESRPRTDKLSNILVKQIGLPPDFEE